MNVLVVAAHPDDEVLGCGGTIPRLVQEGHSVFIAILGEGMTGRYPHRDQVNPEILRGLHAASQKAAKILGATEVFFFDLPDNRFDTIPLLDVVKTLEGLVERLRPKVIYTQHGGDLNLDHLVTFRATLTAARPLPGCTVEAVYAYEVPSSTEYAYQQFEPIFRPNVFVNIAETIDKKLEAMAAYETEVRDFPHPRSPEALEAIARRWGSVAGLPVVEAFQLIRWVQP